MSLIKIIDPSPPPADDDWLSNPEAGNAELQPDPLDAVKDKVTDAVGEAPEFPPLTVETEKDYSAHLYKVALSADFVQQMTISFSDFESSTPGQLKAKITDHFVKTFKEKIEELVDGKVLKDYVKPPKLKKKKGPIGGITPHLKIE